MEKWKRNKTITYHDAGPLVIDVLPQQPHTRPAADSPLMLFRLSADVLLIAGTIEASDVLYHKGYTEKALERFDGAMPVVQKIIARAAPNQSRQTQTIAAIARKLATQLEANRPDVISGSFFHVVDGKRTSNRIDPLVEKLIDAISDLNLN